MAWAILVIDNDGDENYVCDGLGDKPTRFKSRSDAVEQSNFIRMGIESDVQSINIVPYPR